MYWVKLEVNGYAYYPKNISPPYDLRGDYGPFLRLTKDGKVQKAEKKPKWIGLSLMLKKLRCCFYHFLSFLAS